MNVNKLILQKEGIVTDEKKQKAGKERERVGVRESLSHD